MDWTDDEFCGHCSAPLYLDGAYAGSCSREQDEAVLARARENGVAILEANVGLLLAVSKGEVVGRADRSKENSLGAEGAPAFILLSEIEVPVARSKANYSEWERQVKEWRGPAMAARWARTIATQACRDEANELHVDYAAAANIVLQQHGLLRELEGQAYTLSDLLAAERTNTGTTTSERTYSTTMATPQAEIAQANAGSDGDEQVTTRLRYAMQSRRLPQVMVEERGLLPAKL